MGILRVALLAECALVLVLLLQALPPAMAAIGRGIATDPDHPGTCLRNDGTRVRSGDEWDEGCARFYCYDDGKDMIMGFYSCGSVGAGPNCYVTEDLSKPYPDCCPTVKCKRPKQAMVRRYMRSGRHP